MTVLPELVSVTVDTVLSSPFRTLSEPPPPLMMLLPVPIKMTSL